MIDGSFYTIVGTHDTDSLHIRREIVFRMDHVIFQAHFPDNPIVPGVCTLEIIRQLVSEVVGGEIRIPTVKNMNFLNLMTPAEGKVFTFDIQLVAQSETLFSAKTTISDPETIVVKASLLCEKH